MPIDLNVVRNNLYDARTIIDKMMSLVDQAIIGKLIIDTIEITFTLAQKQAMVDRYSILKTNLINKVNVLP